MRSCFGRLLLCAALLVLAAACTPGGASTGNEDGFTTVRVLMGGEPYLDPIITAFQEKYPSIRVEKVPPDETAIPPINAISLPLAEGKVDVVPGYWVPTLARDGLLAPLDAYLKRTTADWAPLGNLDNIRINGRLYALPVSLHPFVLLYNEDLCRQAGVTVPQQPWTWGEFRDAARTLAHRGPDGQVWGFAYPYPQQVLEAYLMQLTPGPGWADNADGVKAGLRFFSELIFSDQAAPPMGAMDEATGRPEIPAGTAFRDGKVALSATPLGSLSGLTSPYFAVGAAPMPVQEGKEPVMVATPRSYALSAKASKPDAAWQFLAFMAGPEGAAAVAQSGTMPAYRTPDTLNLWLGSNPNAPAGLRGLADLPVRLAESTVNRQGPSNDWVLLDAAVKAFRGEISWEAAFEEYQRNKVGAR